MLGVVLGAGGPLHSTQLQGVLCLGLPFFLWIGLHSITLVTPGVNGPVLGTGPIVLEVISCRGIKDGE